MQHNILALELKTLVDNYRLLLIQSPLVLPKAANRNAKAAEYCASYAVSKWHIHTAPNPLYSKVSQLYTSMLLCFSANDEALAYLQSESSNPTSGTISKQNYNSKRYMHLHVHCSSIHNSQEMKTI